MSARARVSRSHTLLLIGRTLAGANLIRVHVMSQTLPPRPSMCPDLTGHANVCTPNTLHVYMFILICVCSLSVFAVILILALDLALEPVCENLHGSKERLNFTVTRRFPNTNHGRPNSYRFPEP